MSSELQQTDSSSLSAKERLYAERLKLCAETMLNRLGYTTVHNMCATHFRAYYGRVPQQEGGRLQEQFTRAFTPPRFMPSNPEERPQMRAYTNAAGMPKDHAELLRLFVISSLMCAEIPIPEELKLPL